MIHLPTDRALSSTKCPHKIQLRDCEIEIINTPTDIQIEGNALASGCDETDRKHNQQIQTELDNGNDWIWCDITIRISWRGLTGEAHLGACSYNSLSEFKACDYYTDLLIDAIDDIRDKFDTINA